jgi:glucokinase
MNDGRFMRASGEGAVRTLLAAMPVKVILNAQTGLLGAAVFGATRANEDAKGAEDAVQPS